MDYSNDPQFKTPDGSMLRMWRDASQNNFLSSQIGRPIFDEVIYVEVISPGSRDSVPVFELVRKPAKESADQMPQFGHKYAVFKEYVDRFERDEQIDGSLSGTSLKAWPEMSKPMVASLRVQNVYTVEALAELPDSRLMHAVGPDGRMWRDKARAFLANAEGAAHATHLAAELAQRDADLVDKQRQIDELAAQVADLSAKIASAGTRAAPEPEKDPETETAVVDTKPKGKPPAPALPVI